MLTNAQLLQELCKATANSFLCLPSQQILSHCHLACSLNQALDLKKLFLSSTKKECFVVRKNAEISEGKQVKMGGGGNLFDFRGKHAMGQHLQKLLEQKGYPLTIWPLECKHNLLVWFLCC